MPRESGERVKDRRVILEGTKQDIWTIWYAAEHGKVARVQSLLEKKPLLVNVQETRMHWSALHYAARYAQEDVIRVLLEKKANPDLVDKHGNTPLHLCAGWGSFHCAVMLLEGGVDTQCVNKDNATALDIAKVMNHIDIIKLLGSWKPIELTLEERREKAKRIAAFKTEEDREIIDEPEMIFLELRALNSKEITLGPTHPGIITTLIKLTKLYREYLREEEAMAALRRALSISQLHYGEDNFDTAILQNNLAELLYHVQELAVSSPNTAQQSSEFIEEAVDLLHKALPFIEKYAENSVRHQSNMDYITCLENLCTCLQKSGKHDLADMYLQRLLVNYSETYGASHDKVIRVQQAIAAKYIAQKRFEEAFSIYENCIRINIEKHGNIHKEVANSWEYLGRGQFLNGLYEKAEDSFKRALAILMELYDASHSDIVRGHNNLAMVALAASSI
ncbi:hypothetical protein THRCLA_01432 [Thraustotheca clavata]|uniref:Uncharacterized protein n=1 Tax=Thraustotheca clavata TaxID=74557 RepID=A0A1W0A890_9STRA|nr:hypothetical protein THRCLA_01432 [Thraustotheca clavata]